jgi:2-keto-4-pentenoate hydratase
MIDLTQMLALRAERIAAGETPIGWKVGFAGAQEKLGVDRPLIGFLLESLRLEDGASVPVGSWTGAAFEAEIAYYVGEDRIGPAIELADIAFPPDDAARIMAGNIYHRHVILGPTTSTDPNHVTGRVLRDGEEIAANDHPAELTGTVEDVVRLTEEALAHHGIALQPGDVIITGSVVPPIPVAPGQRLRAELPPLGALTVALTEK